MKLFFVVLICIALAVPPAFAVGDDARNDTVTPRVEAAFVNATPDVGLKGVYGNYLAWGDYDNDGYQDLLVDGQKLFRNGGPPDFKFAQVTSTAGIGGSGVNNGNWADYDNDGFLDIFCPSGGWSTDYDTRWDVLWHNNGDGTFTNVTEKAGHVTDSFPSLASGWGDYNRDGFVDLYVANYENASSSSYFPDVLWKNNGDGTFTNVTKSAKVDESADPKPGRGVAWCDYDNDNWPDLYVSNYRLKANYLYHNNEDGTFTDVATAKNVEGEPTNRLGNLYYGHSVGACWADINDDGNFDLWLTNLAHKDAYRGPICDDSALYLNNGNKSGYNFTDIRPSSGIPIKAVMGGEDELMVGCCWGDYNNDGYQDLFVPQIYNDVAYAYSYFYRNNGNNTFTEVSNETGVKVWDTYGGCWADYDNDGDVDLLTGGKGNSDVNTSHELHLYRNMLNENKGSTWLEVSLEGVESNRAAIGARVYAWSSSSRTQMREVEGGMGPHSMQNSLTQHFGLPGSPSTVSLRIIWPSGTEQWMNNVSVNQILNIKEASSQKPDLAVVSLDLSSNQPDEGTDVTVKATFKNLGGENAPPAVLSIYEDELYSPAALLADLIVNATAPGASVVLSAVWNTLGKAGNHTLYAAIEKMNLSLDADPANNLLSATATVKNSGQGLPPVARLAVTPSEILVGGTVYLDAGGSFDPDGTIQSYMFSYGDGVDSGWLSMSSVQYIYNDAGAYKATVRVKDNASMTGVSPPITVTVSLPPNKLPVARIASILPSPATVGQEVAFTGDAQDPDGRVVAYGWTSSLDGNLSTELSFRTSGLSLGTHSIHFKVRDDRGAWSADATRSLDVMTPAANIPPTAEIISVLPAPAWLGQMVKMLGNGRDEDGKIVDFKWSSSKDGVIGYGKEFETSNLTIGNHTISLSTRDDGGAWSPEARTKLEIRPMPVTETPNKAPKAHISVSATLINVTTVVRFDGTMSVDSDGSVVEYMFDFGDGTDSCWTISDSVDHAYKTSGQYIVRLKVRDDKGLKSSWSREIVIDVKAKKPASTTKSFIPGMEAPLACAAMLVGMLLLEMKRRRP